MSAETNPGSAADEQPTAPYDLGELLRAMQGVREENERLTSEAAELQRRLVEALTVGVANRESRRATLNLMEDAVQAHAVAQREIVERRRIEEELRAANQRKDEFLATLAHELRNPLAPIRSSLEILRLARADNGATEHVYAVLERQVNHMVRLVDDLLEVSRITRGQIDLRKGPIALSSVVEHALELSRPQIEAARHQFTMSLPDEPLTLWADRTRISQVLANLLHNAAKYTDEGGQIWLTARRDGASVEIIVRDSGLGIPQDMLPKIFDLFTQVDRTLGRAQGGLGIGLTLVQTLVQAHGGSVQAHSEGADKGSEFVVRLPLLETAPTAAESVPRKAHQLPKELGRVLVVDDNRDAAESMATLLKLLGIETATAYNGKSALDVLESHRPSLILLDIGMPEMDGNEVARRIRAQSRFDGITLIALTGWGQDEDRRRCQEAGFQHHLIKPVKLDDLKDLLAVVPPFQTNHRD